MDFRHVPHLRDLSRAFVGQVVGPGDWALDGTAGNGHDTLFLVNLVGDVTNHYPSRHDFNRST